jgi:hypothetical protein
MKVCETVQAGRECEHRNVLVGVFTETRVADVSERLSASPHKSLRKPAQKNGMSYSSHRTAAKTFQLFPYEVHVIQQLLPPECEKVYH